MVNQFEGEGGGPRPLSLRTAVIYAVATIVAVGAGGAVQVGLGRALAGTGGAAVPDLVALVVAVWVFGFCVEVLRRHIR